MAKFMDFSLGDLNLDNTDSKPLGCNLYYQNKLVGYVRCTSEGKPTQIIFKINVDSAIVDTLLSSFDAVLSFLCNIPEVKPFAEDLRVYSGDVRIAAMFIFKLLLLFNRMQVEFNKCKHKSSVCIVYATGVNPYAIIGKVTPNKVFAFPVETKRDFKRDFNEKYNTLLKEYGSTENKENLLFFAAYPFDFDWDLSFVNFRLLLSHMEFSVE